MRASPLRRLDPPSAALAVLTLVVSHYKSGLFPKALTDSHPIASAPSGVQAGTSPSQSSAQASTSPSGAASRVASLSLNAPLAVGGVAAMFGVVVGGLAIF